MYTGDTKTPQTATNTHPDNSTTMHRMLVHKDPQTKKSQKSQKHLKLRVSKSSNIIDTLFDQKCQVPSVPVLTEWTYIITHFSTNIKSKTVNWSSSIEYGERLRKRKPQPYLIDLDPFKKETFEAKLKESKHNKSKAWTMGELEYVL